MRPRCSAVSRVPFGGSAALDAASAPCVGCALIAGHPAHALALHLESVSFRLVRLAASGTQVYPSSQCQPEVAGVRTLFVSLLRLMTKDPQAARETAVERERVSARPVVPVPRPFFPLGRPASLAIIGARQGPSRCREGEGCRGAEIGRYANHEMALMFPIVPLTFLYDSLDQTDGPAEWTATKRNECAGCCQQRQCGLRLMLNRPAKQPGCNAAA